MNESDVLSEEQFDNAAVLSVKSCLGEGLESLFALIDSHRALASLLAAERERREVAERLLEELGKYANSHSASDGRPELLGALYRIGEECERHFSNYGSEE